MLHLHSSADITVDRLRASLLPSDPCFALFAWPRTQREICKYDVVRNFAVVQLAQTGSTLALRTRLSRTACYTPPARSLRSSLRRRFCRPTLRPPWRAGKSRPPILKSLMKLSLSRTLIWIPLLLLQTATPAILVRRNHLRVPKALGADDEKDNELVCYECNRSRIIGPSMDGSSDFPSPCACKIHVPVVYTAEFS